MKIVIMTSGTVKGSLSYRPLALARQLYKRGHDVYIIAPRFDKYSKFIDEKISEIDGVKIIRPIQIKTFSFELGLIPYIVSSIITLHRLNPDIVHIYKSTPITIPGLLLRLTRGTSLIFDTDDLDGEVMRIENNSLLKVKLVQLSEKLSTRFSNAIITGSKFLQEMYSTQYKNKPIVHVPNGADFKNTGSAIPRQISNNRIIFVGNINRTNILSPLFYSLKELNQQNIKINGVIIGDGEYLQYFKKLAKKLKIDNVVTFTGWIPQNQLYKHIKTGNIGYCYMPNELTIKACSSMKVFQYMQYGAVPLVSNVGDLPYYIDFGKGGYIAKHSNKDDLIKTIKIAVKHKKERVKKINYAKKYAKQTFSWRSLTTEVEKVYESIVNPI